MWDPADWQGVWYTNEDWLWGRLPPRLVTLCAWPMVRPLQDTLSPFSSKVCCASSWHGKTGRANVRNEQLTWPVSIDIASALYMLHQQASPYLLFYTNFACYADVDGHSVCFQAVIAAPSFVTLPRCSLSGASASFRRFFHLATRRLAWFLPLAARRHLI